MSLLGVKDVAGLTDFLNRSGGHPVEADNFTQVLENGLGSLVNVDALGKAGREWFRKGGEMSGSGRFGSGGLAGFGAAGGLN